MIWNGEKKCHKKSSGNDILTIFEPSCGIHNRELLSKWVWTVFALKFYTWWGHQTSYILKTSLNPTDYIAAIGIAWMHWGCNDGHGKAHVTYPLLSHISESHWRNSCGKTDAVQISKKMLFKCWVPSCCIITSIFFITANFRFYHLQAGERLTEKLDDWFWRLWLHK